MNVALLLRRVGIVEYQKTGKFRDQVLMTVMQSSQNSP